MSEREKSEKWNWEIAILKMAEEESAAAAARKKCTTMVQKKRVYVYE
jgi:hypothetical protein